MATATTLCVDVINLDETKDLVRELIAEWNQTLTDLDQARNIAVKLEAELAVKDALLRRVLDWYASSTHSTGELHSLKADITAALEVEA